LYTIEKGIPIPPIKQASTYPFNTMEVDDSFLVETDREDIVESARSAAQWHAQKYGKKFVTRTVEGGLRIWRVK
jgi:hypothetical protein